MKILYFINVHHSFSLGHDDAAEDAGWDDGTTATAAATTAATAE